MDVVAARSGGVAAWRRGGVAVVVGVFWSRRGLGRPLAYLSLHLRLRLHLRLTVLDLG